ncbi:MAG: ABC transporter substrate-binding protein [Bdellovibrionales bacterium]|nr:ABC transporter substrate-binding protein [Bdellovibrionales bacterium]
MSIKDLPASLDPTKVAFMEHFLLLQAFQQTLIRMSESGRIVSDLARSWQISKDGKVITLNLDPHATFHNNKKVSSSDVVYSFSRHVWPESKSVVSGYLKLHVVGADRVKSGETIEGVKVIDEHTVQFHLKKPYSPFLYILTIPGFTIIPAGAEEDNIIGSGPYIIDYKNNDKIVFKKNNLYPHSSNALKKIVVQSQPDYTKAISDLKSGNINLYIGISPKMITNKTIDNELDLQLSETLIISHLYFNPRKSISKNAEFRSDLSSVFSGLADEALKTNKYFNKLNTFVPYGLMQTGYYRRDRKNVTIKEFKRKWGRFLKNYKVVIFEEAMPSEFINSAKGLLSSVKGHLDIVKREHLVKTLIDKNYDLVGGRYVGNFPDPDGYLNVINSHENVHMGGFDTTEILDTLSKYKNNLDANFRLKMYSVELEKFESKNLIIPLFLMKVPILRSRSLVFPDTTFRYQGEFWKSYWN